MHEFTEVANYYTCQETEVDPRIKKIWEIFLACELEHLRIAGETLRRLQGKEPQEVCGTELPTPATFETNREYVTGVIQTQSDLRLVAGGKWTRVAELPDDWPSLAYQRVVHEEGAPSESVVRLRMEAAGVELVRARDPELEEQAGRHRVASLDPEPAPNTVPAEYVGLEPFERAVEPGDHGDARLVNPVEDPAWPRAAEARTPARKGKGR
jgi:hypothetical protein